MYCRSVFSKTKKNNSPENGDVVFVFCVVEWVDFFYNLFLRSC
jgi:hypothetical protein